MSPSRAQNAVDYCERLATGSPRGLGDSNTIAGEAVQDPARLPELLQALKDPRPVVQNRAARALKKAQAISPRLLDPFAKQLLRSTLECTDLRTRWNLLIVCGNLVMKGSSRALAVDMMFDSLRSESPLVRTFALQALVNFAASDPALRTRVQPLVELAMESPSPAERARARKLLRAQRRRT